MTLPLEQVKQKLGLHLTKRQSRGVEVAMERNLSIITGGPGTGKTTVLKAIIEVYRILHPKNRIVLAAPTGKASRRMAQSTGMLDALTLHSLLGLQGDFCSKDKQDQPLQVDFLIVDEASMVDMWLAHQLFTRLQKDTKLLLLGDVDQLESVGAGNVFAELIGSGIVPVTVLDEIFRQSKDSLIAYNAKFINEENSSLFYGPDFQFVKAENQEEAAAQIQDALSAGIAGYVHWTASDHLALSDGWRSVLQRPERADPRDGQSAYGKDSESLRSESVSFACMTV